MRQSIGIKHQISCSFKLDLIIQSNFKLKINKIQIIDQKPRPNHNYVMDVRKPKMRK